MDAETKTDVNKTVEPGESLSVEYYKEICASIRFSDDISFKLLSIVPALSGVGSTALLFLEKSQLLANYSSCAIVLLSVCGAAITFGLFRWELRNIQKCNWYIERAADFERRLFKKEPIKSETLQFAGFGKLETKKNPDRANFWGKTESEKLIYGVAIAVWLIPIIMVVLRDMETVGSMLRKNIPSATGVL